MNAKEASETAKKKLAEVLNKKANATAAISKDGDGWKAVVEMIDEEYLPGHASMNDIIGVYVATLDAKGELLSWEKKTIRKRGDRGQSSG